MVEITVTISYMKKPETNSKPLTNQFSELKRQLEKLTAQAQSGVEMCKDVEQFIEAHPHENFDKLHLSEETFTNMKKTFEQASSEIFKATQLLFQYQFKSNYADSNSEFMRQLARGSEFDFENKLRALHPPKGEDT